MDLLTMKQKIAEFKATYKCTPILHGGGALLAYGLRKECSDIDAIIPKSVFEKIKKEHKLKVVNHGYYSSMIFGDFDLSYYGLNGYYHLKNGVTVYDLVSLIEQKFNFIKTRKLSKDSADLEALIDLFSRKHNSVDGNRYMAVVLMNPRAIRYDQHRTRYLA